MFIVYKTTNEINGKYYIGAHETNHQADRYLGSGKWIKLAIKKYGRKNFTKETLAVFDNKKDMLLYEQKIVDHKDPLSYNVCPGGGGASNGHLNKLHSKRTKQKLKQASRKQWKNMSEEKKKNCLSGLQSYHAGDKEAIRERCIKATRAAQAMWAARREAKQCR